MRHSCLVFRAALAMEQLTMGHPFLSSCITTLHGILSSAAISELVVEPAIPKALLHDHNVPEHDKHHALKCFAHSDTPEGFVDFFWDGKALVLSRRLVLACHGLALPFLSNHGAHGVTPPTTSAFKGLLPELLHIASFLVLLLDGGSHAALSVRALLLSRGHTKSQSELMLLEPLIRLHPKTNALWMYRRYVLQRNGVSRAGTLNEMKLITSEATRVAHNYFPWVHWAWLMNGDKEDSPGRVSCSEVTLNLSEDQALITDSLQKAIGLSPFHLAPYHHLFLCLKRWRNVSPETKDTSRTLSATLLTLYPQSEAAWLFRSLITSCTTQRQDNEVEPVIELPQWKRWNRRSGALCESWLRLLMDNC